MTQYNVIEQVQWIRQTSSVVIHPELKTVTSCRYPFLEVHWFSSTSLLENLTLLETAYMCRPVRVHIFAPDFSHCLFCHDSKEIQEAKESWTLKGITE